MENANQPKPDLKPGQIFKYGTIWQAQDDLDIEMAAFRAGGKWKNSKGEDCGNGLFFHAKEFQKLLWPHKKWHKWNDLLLSKYCEYRIVGVMGPASSTKTHEASAWALINYFAYSDEITILVSSTDSRGLELRVWGEIKKYWSLAKERYSNLPGHIMDSRTMITTNGREMDVRDFRNGIVGIPCVVNHTYVGIGKYAGIKNKRVILIGDELQFMAGSFLEAIANLDSNQSFQCIGMGNPKDQNDALGKLCEPSDKDGGWEGRDISPKTKTWRTRFMDGICIQLYGTDSPNFDVPEGQPAPFPFIITRKKVQNVIEFYGKDSMQYWMQCIGDMPDESIGKRVLTRAFCVKFHALEEAVWDIEPSLKIVGLDAGYGGDRCVLTELHIGRDVKGRQIMAFAGKPVIVPVSVGRGNDLPEDQIARFVMNYCNDRGIKPENVFFDSTGRGTLGTSFARLWSAQVQPVEFGGVASDRPVSAQIRTPCKDHYSKFVTELWFSVRRIIESDQFRQLPEEVMAEGCMREYKIVSRNREEIETKDEMKLRMGRSPDLFDSLCCGVEGARQRGFQIAGLGEQRKGSDQKWLRDLFAKSQRLNKREQLIYTP
jgi:hypothetical protein